MHIFQLTTLLYLSLHALAYVLMFVSIMGIPGNPDATKSRIKFLLKLGDIFLLMAWKGIPVLAVASILAFFFHYDLMGKIMSCLSLGIGLSLFLTLVLYYTNSSKK